MDMQPLTPLTPATGMGQLYASDPRLKLKDGDTIRMKEAAQTFEAQYVFQLLELMAPKIEEANGISSGGFAEETFRPQLHDAIAKQVVRQGGFGVAENVYTELLTSQARGSGVQVTPEIAAQSYASTPVTIK